jgi:hypothetical protein
MSQHLRFVDRFRRKAEQPTIIDVQRRPLAHSYYLTAEFNLEVHHSGERPPREFETQGISWDGG